MKKILTFLIAYSITYMVYANPWVNDFAAATNRATTAKKPLFLNFTGSDWCGWCKLMDEKVFATKKWQTFASNNLVCVIVDFPRDKSKVTPSIAMQNKILSSRFNIEGFPTFVMLSSDGQKELARFGCPGRNVTPNEFIKKVKAVKKLKPSSRIDSSK